MDQRLATRYRIKTGRRPRCHQPQQRLIDKTIGHVEHDLQKPFILQHGQRLEGGTGLCTLPRS